jgi:hypothetical protein
MTLDEYFSTGPPHERPVFDAVRAHLLHEEVEVVVEPVSVGIFLKRSRTVVELRPKERWVAVSFSLRRQVRHPLITRRVVPYGTRFFHVANVATPDDLDDDLLGWLVEACLDTPP